ncbi:ROK family transcriptional regulator [Streptomyces sp. HPF1205]|uniref:ROK family transcriptional regulator n=1 Tax=Streptomyces sp. HPF1205 TaxID=2873262 RepID=UPI001CECDBEC|nr:ROK family transcriptional regulator [Streptomyces sp. HPF1205]
MQLRIAATRTGSRERVIELLRTRGALTRADLARSLGLSRATVSNVVAALHHEGLVIEPGGTTAAGGLPRQGRPGTLLTLNPTAGFVVGIDFGHTHVRVIVADLAHTVLAENTRTLVRDHDAHHALTTAAGMAEETLAASGVDRAKVIGVGAGVPGPVNALTGAVGASSIAPSWVGLRPAEELARRLGLPVLVDNVGNLGALAEVTWGAGQGAQVAAYIKLGTGVGAGFVLGGRIFRGACGTAAELGHLTVDPAGQVCRCGNRGCLENYVSLPALISQLRTQYDTTLTKHDVVALALAGDRACARVLADAGQRIGAAMATICNLFNPDRVIVGGELAAACDIMLPSLRNALDRDALPFAGAHVQVCRGQLGERAVALGAIATVLHATPRLGGSPRPAPPAAAHR